MSEAAGVIRPATVDDAPAIARVQVRSWRETYAGLMPDDFLARMTGDERQARMTLSWSQAASDARQVLVVAEAAGQVVGFVAGGPAQGFPEYGGELYALYLLRAQQGRGVGRALVAELARRMHILGHRDLMLWVLDTNPTRDFYGHLGGVKVGEKTQDWSGTTLREVAYGWPDIERLLGAG